MQLTIFGASGGTGRQLVQRALAAGHQVTAVARTPARIDSQHERLHVVRGDVLEPASIAPTVAGADAVVSAIGSVRGEPTGVQTAGTRNILRAMRDAGVQRLVVVSAAPINDDDRGTTLPYRRLLKPLLWAVFRDSYTDMARMEEEVRRSGVDWTIMRPPRLTDKPGTGRYRVAVNGNLRRGYTISRADLADAILRLLSDPDAVKAAIGIAD